MATTTNGAVPKSRKSECYANALDVVDRLTQAVSLSHLIDELDRSLETYGIDRFVITGLPSPHERFERVVVLRRLPDEWFRIYAREDFVRDDPVIRLCRNTTAPFEWHEAPFDPEREPRARAVMNGARDFGLKRGFTLPIHGLNGYEACFSASGTHPDFNQGTKPALHLIGMYAFEQARKLSPQAEANLGPNPLTCREREILTWAAVGKSYLDIAEILSVTERTVTAHMVNAARKLGATNKTHTVVRAILEKRIRV